MYLHLKLFQFNVCVPIQGGHEYIKICLKSHTKSICIMHFLVNLFLLYMLKNSQWEGISCTKGWAKGAMGPAFVHCNTGDFVQYM